MCVHARPGFVHGHHLPQTHTCADDDGGGGGGLAVVFLCACAYQLQGCHPVADVCMQICQPHARVHGTRCVARNRIHGEKGRLSTITEREREKVCVCLCVCLCLSVCLCVCVCVSVCFSLTYTHSLPPSPTRCGGQRPAHAGHSSGAGRHGGAAARQQEHWRERTIAGSA